MKGFLWETSEGLEMISRGQMMSRELQAGVRLALLSLEKNYEVLRYHAPPEILVELERVLTRTREIVREFDLMEM